MSRLKHIRNYLPELTSDELERLRLEISALQAFGGLARTIENAPDEARWVVSVLCDVLRSKGDCAAIPGIIFQSEGAMDDLKAKMPGLHQYLDNVGRPRLARHALLKIAFQLLYKNLQDIGVPPGIRTMIRNIHRIPAVMDIHFPGYARNGLLKLLIQREGHGHVRAE